MSRLSRKFLISLSLILAAVACLSIFLNRNFVGRYLLYREKQDLHRICGRLTAGDLPREEAIRWAEDNEDVVVAQVEGTRDNDLLNQRLREAFLVKGVSMDRYWLWEQDQADAMEDGSKLRVYSQKKLHYSLMVEYLWQDGSFMAVAKIIPSVSRTVALVNQVTLAVFAGGFLLALVLIYVLVRRITSPLKSISQTARAISALDFQTVTVRTGDELEDLAQDINHMSTRLRQAHLELEQKNRQMEDLLGNVSHDLKTPVSLIKAYASGMKDGVDDGTFLDTIIVQNNRMEQILEQLLNLARVQKTHFPRQTMDLPGCLHDLIQEYRLQADSSRLQFYCDIPDSYNIPVSDDIPDSGPWDSGHQAPGNQAPGHQTLSHQAPGHIPPGQIDTFPGAVRLILSNLLSNAVKYAADGQIWISLCCMADGCMIRIKNMVGDPGHLDLEKLWEPFYVAEPSRNKDMSGTGLGLSIVRTTAAKYGMDCTCSLENHMITFSLFVKSL